MADEEEKQATPNDEAGGGSTNAENESSAVIDIDENLDGTDKLKVVGAEGAELSGDNEINLDLNFDDQKKQNGPAQAKAGKSGATKIATPKRGNKAIAPESTGQPAGQEMAESNNQPAAPTEPTAGATAGAVSPTTSPETGASDIIGPDEPTTPPTAPETENQTPNAPEAENAGEAQNGATPPKAPETENQNENQPPATPPTVPPGEQGGAAGEMAGDQAKDARAENADQPAGNLAKGDLGDESTAEKGGGQSSPEKIEQEKQQEAAQEMEQARLRKNEKSEKLNSLLGPTNLILVLKNRKQLRKAKKEKKSLEKDIKKLEKEIKKLKPKWWQWIILIIYLILACFEIGIPFLVKQIEKFTQNKLELVIKQKKLKDLQAKLKKNETQIYNLQNFFKKQAAQEVQASQVASQE